MPVVAQAVVNYFLYNKPVIETLYECNNILDFCKSQNVETLNFMLNLMME